MPQADGSILKDNTVVKEKLETAFLGTIEEAIIKVGELDNEKLNTALLSREDLTTTAVKNNILYNILDEYQGEEIFFRRNNTVNTNKVINYPEWYKEINGVFYERTSVEVTPDTFGAIGDGVHHPLSERFATLQLAQVYYPFATSLTDSIDRISAQKAINFLKAGGGGTLKINSNKTYNLNSGSIVVDSANLNIIGYGTVKNGTIKVNGASAGSQFNFKIEGLRIIRDSFTVGEKLDTQNGIELQNVSRGIISNCYFEKTNCNVYVRPTGVFQQTSRIAVLNCRSQSFNYAIKVEETPDTGNPGLNLGEQNFSKRSIGDFLVANCTFQWAYYDHIYGYGLDGFQLDNIYCFSTPTDQSNKATKRCNINFHTATYVTMNNMNLFEAGEDAIRLTNCDNITGSTFNIAWCGQRLASSGIHFIRTTVSSDVEVSNSFSNVLIDTPTLNGIYIEGTFPTQMYIFDNIRVNKLGRSDRYYGADTPDYNNPGLGTYNHNTIYTDASVSGVIYNGCYDSEWITRCAKFDGVGCFGRDINTRRGVEKIIRGKNSVTDDLEIARDLLFIENLLASSNALSTPSRFTASNGTTVVPLVDSPSPLGTGTIYKFVEDSGVNTQKSLILTTSIVKPSAKLPYTVSFFAKADTREFLCLYVGKNSLSSTGIKIDYDVKRGSTGAIQIIDPNYELIDSKIRLANNGFYKIELSFMSPETDVSVRFAIYLKDAIQNVGNQSYVGDGDSGLFLCDFQVSQTSIPLPYLPTNGTAQVRKVFRYNGIDNILGTANQVIAVNNNGEVTLSLPQSIGIGSSPTFTGANLNSASAANLDFNFKTAGINKWTIRKTNTEDLQIIRRDASGNFVANSVSVSKDTGRTTLESLRLLEDPPIYADNAAALAGGLVKSDTYTTSTGAIMRVF